MERRLGPRAGAYVASPQSRRIQWPKATGSECRSAAGGSIVTS